MGRNEELYDICFKLEGYHGGFEVLKAQKNDDGTWDLKVLAYKNNVKEETDEDK